MLIVMGSHAAMAQGDDPANGETDPIKIFERGQDAHAKRDFKTAIQLYDAAIKLKPEFPEAEFQRAMALLVTDHANEAIEGFNRAVSVRTDWALAYGTFGRTLATTGGNDREAERILRRAIELDGKDLRSLELLAEVRKRAGDLEDARKLISLASSLPTADATVWRHRASIEFAAGDKDASLKSIDHALMLNPADDAARRFRAELRLDQHDNDGAIADLRLYEKNAAAVNEFPAGYELARLYARAGQPEAALRLLEGLRDQDKQRAEVIALRAELSDDAGLSDEERAALEELLKRQPQDTNLLARLGSAYRRSDPVKSQDYYGRALKLEPRNPRFATGYAAALVQQRQFGQAEKVLRQVISESPDSYPAHANLALALFEMKRFAEALPEYEWLATTKPDIAVTYFFIAIAHDNLGEYQQALDAYQKFLARADSTNNKLEIDKVNLRLPKLRDQIKRGEGVKQKNP